MTAAASPKDDLPTLHIDPKAGITLTAPTLAPLKPDTLEDVMPGDLPEAQQDDAKNGMHEISFYDYLTDRDRADRISRFMRAMRERIAEAEPAIMQMQDSVDGATTPSPLQMVQMFREDINELTPRSFVKTYFTSEILTTYVPHETARDALETAKDFVDVAERRYRFYFRNFKHRLEVQYMNRYGDGEPYKLSELMILDPVLCRFLRRKYKSKIKFKPPPMPDPTKPNDVVAVTEVLEDQSAGLVFMWYRERLLMERGRQAEVAYDEVKDCLLKAEIEVNMVEKKSRKQSSSGGYVATVRKEIRGVRERRQQQQTMVQTTVQNQ